MAGVSDKLAPELPTFHPTIYRPYGTLHPLHLNSNVSLVLDARSVHFSPLPSNIFSDHRWALFPKSARNPLNGVSFTIFHGPPLTPSTIPFLSIIIFSCTYNTLNTAIAPLKSFGQGALMSKLDLSDAFRHILVHPADWELLGS